MSDGMPDRRKADALAQLAGGGEMGERTRAFDWSRTPVGPIAAWPRSLTTLIRTMLDSRYAMWLGWGPDLTFFYNDAYAQMTLGPKHPWALGRPAREVWSEIWPDIGPRAESVMRTGKATWDEGLLLFLERQGFAEETYHTFSYSPIPDDAGAVGGMLCVVTEDTDRVIGERRLKTLRELADRATGEARSAEEACRAAAAVIAKNDRDVPFALFYLLDASGRRATLAGSVRLPQGSYASPAEIDLSSDGPWPFRAVAASGRPIRVDDLVAKFGPLPGGAWPEPPLRAVVLPMAKPGQSQLAGFVVAGISPRRPYDDGYRGFLDLLAGQAAGAVASARAYDEERQRAEGLAELDRAKTAFFSNVSHEFRTPLTLMLGPLDDILAKPAGGVLPENRELLEVVRRNGLRLQRLVNSLLDFSRIEAGRVRALYEPTDLAAFTIDLASNFRSACERAGLRLIVDCDPLGEPVFVDRPMWEKIVLNLLSNAFKFTLAGEIEVSVRRAGTVAELRVRDTGSGIPAAEMPRLFERFHRVENVKGRTHEGSGIGLALVQELVRLHGGAITAHSEEGTGTTFTVSIPFGASHLPRDRVGAGNVDTPSPATAAAFVEEALHWLPSADGAVPPADFTPSADGTAVFTLSAGPDLPRVLVADDNADMRQYVGRLLAGRYQIETVADGETAFAAARRVVPDLVLSDVMMPRLDGFGLLKRLRSDPATAGVPVILLSARAGEESRVEGVEAGADDYVVKPFSARELLAKVAGALALSRARREAVRREQELKAEAVNILESMSDGFVSIDRDWRFTYVNAAAERMIGLTRQEMLGRVQWELFPATVGTPNETGYRRAMAERTPVRFENFYPPQDAWYEVDTYPMAGAGIGVYFRDVTARKRAEEALRESQRFIERVANTSPAVMFVYDLEERRNVYSNRDIGAVLGYPPGESNGVDAEFQKRVLHPDDLARDPVPAFAAMADGEIKVMEYRMRDATGAWHWRQSHLTVFARHPDGRPRQILGVSQDVTAQKEAEAQLREADRRKDEFLALLAHELRNPLAPIRNGLQVLRLSDDPEAAARARAMMDRQLSHMVRLIDDLLDVSRVTRNKMVLRRERLRLADAVAAAVETARPTLEAAGHDLVIQLPPEDVWLDADLTRLSQVFSNLLTNSAKYTPERGRVRLTAEVVGGQVAVRVRDNGIGIPAESLPNIFDMFSQVDRSIERATGGLGIGLALVKGLVEMHGGTVEAHSDGPGRGTEFVVCLPVITDSSPEISELGFKSEIPNPRSEILKKVLVVDDNRDAAESMGLMLELLGAEVRTAHDGLEAVAAADAFRPEVILMDVGMPRLNGLDAARRIRAQPWSRGMTIIALTGWGQDADRERSRTAGCDGHLVKPVALEDLERLLRVGCAAK